MRKILSTSEIVQDLDFEVEPKELCATAEADYDDRKSSLVIKLDAFVRQVHTTPGRMFAPDLIGCRRPKRCTKEFPLKKQANSRATSSTAGRREYAKRLRL